MGWTQALMIFGSVGLSALAQVLLKSGALAARSDAGAAAFLAVLTAPATLAGLFVYAASALLWLRVLARLPLSQAYPFVALGIVLTTLAGVIVFGEAVVGTRMLGVALIFAGVVLVGYR